MQKIIGRIIIVLFVHLLVLHSLLNSSQKNQKKGPDLTIGDAAPNFALPSLESKTIFLRDFCGEKLRKPWINKTKYAVVISFFATWCKPCMKEIPVLEELQEKYKDKSVKFFLIDETDKKETLLEFKAEKKVTIPILMDTFGIAAKNYKVNEEGVGIVLPRLYVLDKNGKIHLINKGFDGRLEDFKMLLTGLLDQLTVNE